MRSKKLARLAVKQREATQKITELSPFISLLRKRRLRTIVEIGTAKGGTLYVWCKIAEPDALLVSIDMPGGPFGGGYTFNDVKKFRTYKRKKQNLHFLRKNSHKPTTKKALMKILNGRKIDFLLIDGDHS